MREKIEHSQRAVEATAAEISRGRGTCCSGLVPGDPAHLRRYRQ